MRIRLNGYAIANSLLHSNSYGISNDDASCRNGLQEEQLLSLLSKFIKKHGYLPTLPSLGARVRILKESADAHLASKYHIMTVLLLIVQDREGTRYRLCIDVDCLARCVDPEYKFQNVFDLTLQVGLLAGLIVERLDEVDNVRRAVYYALYNMLKNMGVRDYFKFSKIVDSCVECVREC